MGNPVDSGRVGYLHHKHTLRSLSQKTKWMHKPRNSIMQHWCYVIKMHIFQNVALLQVFPINAVFYQCTCACLYIFFYILKSLFAFMKCLCAYLYNRYLWTTVSLATAELGTDLMWCYKIALNVVHISADEFFSYNAWSPIRIIKKQSVSSTRAIQFQFIFMSGTIVHKVHIR